ncbi:alpha/beta hydrolase [Humibacter albus]|jgi:hypothetical protein|uniref:alpha/beta hydrolase n=1 Tax=Humibacter albus TaxID=427754 RepID=UPI0004192F5A|nr:alpha/beta hydrolase [Humibacter albus]
MNWRRTLSLVVVVLIGLVGITIAPIEQNPVASSRYSFLDSLSSSELLDYVSTHPGATVGFLRLHPKSIAGIWDDLSRKARTKMTKSQPSMVGQLEGVDYRSRDRANRLRLAKKTKLARAAVAKNPSDDVARQTLKCLLAIRGALRKHHPQRYLIDLTNGAKPLAAISIGDVDQARLVTYAVPGMGTYTDDMQLWAQGAQNIYDAQGEAGATRKRAVIAWIGYVTPPPGIDAALGAYARAGAAQLIESVNGFWAARGKKARDTVTLNIVAHSYGTTTSADALFARALNVYSFVMLGSAGIEERISSARQLHAAHVFAGEAKGDTEAQWGRISRSDPRSPSFGAIRLAVDGNPNKHLSPVTGHAPILHSAWNDNPESSAWSHLTNRQEFKAAYRQHLSTFGYLDAGTQSIMSVAGVTVPPKRDPHAATVSPAR